MEVRLTEEADQIHRCEDDGIGIDLPAGVGPPKQLPEDPGESRQSGQTELRGDLEVLVVEMAVPVDRRLELHEIGVEDLPEGRDVPADPSAEDGMLPKDLPRNHHRRHASAEIAVIPLIDQRSSQLVTTLDNPRPEAGRDSRDQQQRGEESGDDAADRAPRPPTSPMSHQDHEPADKSQMTAAPDVDREAADREQKQTRPQNAPARGHRLVEDAGQDQERCQRQHQAVIEVGHGGRGVARVGAPNL